MEHTPPPFFNRGPSPLARLFVCCTLSLALLISDSRYRYLDDVRQVISVITYPVQQLPHLFGLGASRIADFFVTQNALNAANERLTKQNLQDAAIIQQYQALVSENAHLRDLLGARQRFPESTTVAEVLYSGRDPFTRKIIVDKGGQHAVKAGQPVIDNVGVVGQVTRVYPWLSEITLITDKDQVVPVQNLRNGLRAVLGGTGGTDQLELKFIPLNADFQNGDQLVTSGLDGVYPPGLPVALVSNVERDAAYLFARITCKPLAGVASHSLVMIVNWENKAPARPAPEATPPHTKKPPRGGD